MVRNFRHLSNPDFIFGNNKYLLIPDLLQGSRINPKNPVLVVTGRHFSKTPEFSRLVSKFHNSGTSFFHTTVHGEPSTDTVDNIVSSYKNKNISAVVSIGGGSVMDTGKAAAAMFCEEGSLLDYLEDVGNKKPSGKTLFHIAVPTTAGTGSEATKNAVIANTGKNGFKKSLRHNSFIPQIALIDPSLSAGLPHEITVASGLDAFTQLLEAFTSTAATPLTDILAREGLFHFARGCRLFTDQCYGEPEESGFREELSLAAYFSGLSLANAGLGTVHGLAGPLGAVCPVPHGNACSLLISPVFKKISAKLKEEEDTEFLNRIYLTASLIVNGEYVKPKISDLDKLFNKINKWTNGFPGLSSYGITDKDLETVVSMSGNKNSPIKLCSAERLKILESLM